MQTVQSMQSMQSVQSAIANNQQGTLHQNNPKLLAVAKVVLTMTLSERGKWATFPQLGDTIAGYQISSAFWPRKSPDPGCSSMHFGTDVATLMYTPLYANGPIGGTVNVRC